MENVVKSGIYDFTIRRGEHDVHQLLYWTFNNTAFDLEKANDIRVDFRRNPRINGAADLSLSLENGGVKVKSNNLDMIFGVNTLNLFPGIYYYDVLVIVNSNRYTWVKGQMVLEDVITR